MSFQERASAIAAELDRDCPERAVELAVAIIDSRAVSHLVEAEFRALLTGAPPQTKNAPAGQLHIVRSPDADVRVRAIAADANGAGSIKTLTRNTLVANAGRTAFIVRRWQRTAAPSDDVFSARKTIAAAGETLVEPGEAVVMHAGVDAYDLVGDARPALALTVAGAHRVPLAWLYDRKTRRAVALEPTGRDWLLTQELVAFADALGDRSLAPALASLHDHPSHFVRWAATKAVARVAPDGGRYAFGKRADDVHPQVRFAARHQLEALGPA